MQVSKEKAEAKNERQVRITDVGHSTMLIELAGLKILTDPWFTDPILGIVTHPKSIGMRIEDVPDVDSILISHGHFDHCDLKAISKLNRSAVIIVPEIKTARRIKKLGYSDVAVLAPWESRLVSNVRVTALPASHPVPECAYVISSEGTAVYFGGDTRYVRDLQQIGEYVRHYGGAAAHQWAEPSFPRKGGDGPRGRRRSGPSTEGEGRHSNSLQHIACCSVPQEVFRQERPRHARCLFRRTQAAQ